MILAWRLETAFDAAWPAVSRTPVGDWTCRLSGGVSRRGNSANPAGPASRLTDADLADIAAIYAAAGQPAYVRIPSALDPAVDERLQAAGWAMEGVTLTLVAPLDIAHPDDVEVSEQPSTAWRAALNAVNARSAPASAAFDAIIEQIRVPAAFVAVRREGRIVSGGYGALAQNWLCISAIATEPAWRGRGLARQVVSALIGWGAGRGGEGAALQVADGNAAGLKLYERLGFTQEAYRYHYRRGP